MADAGTEVETGPGPGSRRWLALLTCCSALFMTLLDVSVTNVALPSIADSTGAGPSGLQWVVSGYTLAFGLVPVLAGKLGDDHGRKTMFQVGVASFALTSMLAGVAPTTGFLIAARVLQGLAGGLINPQVSGLVQQMFPGPERGRAFGVLGTTVGVGTALGPLVGGLLIFLGGPGLGWRLAFFVNVPVGIAVILLSRRLLPAHPPVGKHRLDVLGAGVLGVATFCVLFACVQYDHLQDTRLAWLGVPALVFLGWFIARERRLTRELGDPLVDVRLFRRPSYTAGVLLALTFFPAMAGLPLVLALFYQRGLGYSALQSALGITAYAAGSALAAPLAGRVVVRVGRPLVVAGAFTFGVGAVALAVIATHGPDERLALAMAPALFVMGIGQGAVVTPNQTLTLMDVDPAVGSTAGGVLQTGQRIGLALGQAVIGAVFFAALGSATASDSADPYAPAIGAAVLAALGFIVLALVVSMFDLIQSGRRRRGEHTGVVEPTPYDAAGGAEAFLALATAHHARCLADPELNHPFSHDDNQPDHVERLAAYWAEVLGGPPTYSSAYGRETDVLRMHSGNGDLGDLGRRFVSCFDAAVDDAGLPDDPALRRCLHDYMVWAVDRVLALGEPDEVPATAMPHWGWRGPTVATHPGGD